MKYIYNEIPAIVKYVLKILDYIGWLHPLVGNYPLPCYLIRLWKSSSKSYDHVEENGTPKRVHPKGAPPKNLAAFAEEYRKLAIDCLKVLRIEMLLETIFHLQVPKICLFSHKNIKKKIIYLVRNHFAHKK